MDITAYGFSNHYIDKIIRWSKDRKIDINSRPNDQILKTYEEAGELALHYDLNVKDNDVRNLLIENIKDDIGDILVTLIIIEHQIYTTYFGVINQYIYMNAIDKNFNQEETIDLDYASSPFKNIMFLLGSLSEEIARIEFMNHKRLIRSITYQLGVIAKDNNFTLNDALEKAYNDIKNRAGHMNKNGIFIKDK